jgi:Uma2 family endonuclease
MHEILQRKILPTTQGAAGVPRLRWTLAEFERLAELGFFTDEDHIELIGGELVPLAPKTVRHETVRSELLNSRGMRGLPTDVGVAAALGWRLNEDTYLEPDFLLYPEARKRDIPHLPPTEVMLAIEVADLSLEFDTTFKARLYAALDVREYWVVNAVSPMTHVYRGPSAAGYAEVRVVPASAPLISLLVPTLALKLADLRLDR